jgi:predicted NAD/FAD-binding protein
MTHGIDTGFLVYNERTYPHLIALFEQLGVQTAKSDMSFSVQVPGAHKNGTLEWSGTNLSTVFAQRSNLWNPKFLGMLRHLLRFNKLCTAIALQGDETQLEQPLGVFIREHGFSDAFCNWYLLPMLGCIWSCPTDQMLAFPVSTMIRFCRNHGLMQVTNRPQWHTVAGGARQYVNKIVENIADKRLNTPVELIERDAQGVHIRTQGHSERFDKVVIATHAPQALALLGHASDREKSLLSAFRTQHNKAVLHTDASVLPSLRSTWAAWNYVRGSDNQEPSRVCLHYLINKLQPIPFEQAVVVSLNPTRAIVSSHVLQEFDYSHPVFDAATTAAQQRLGELQGQQHTYFCGAWTGYGFHEDGLTSGLTVARQLLQATQADRPQSVSAA